MTPIRVLIIDDSAFARKVIREVLSRDPEIEVVGIARDGLEGLEKIGELRPDVVTLDLIMPELDGLGVLRALQKTWSPKIVVVSISGPQTELALEALENGAVELVTKPTPMASDRLYELSDELVAKVKIAAQAKQILKVDGVEDLPEKVIRPSTGPSWARVLVIGTSTGGPQALASLFRALPSDLPVAIAVALHIPPGYTAGLAARISQKSAVKMIEAQNGMELIPGQALIAPGGMHLSLRSNTSGTLFAVVGNEPFNTAHHPSVDVLFQSAAASAGDSTLGLILTGMGSDGLAGAEAIVRKGGKVLAESASSCVVYGMPRSVIEAGFAAAEAPLPHLSNLLIKHIFNGKPRV